MIDLQLTKYVLCALLAFITFAALSVPMIDAAGATGLKARAMVKYGLLVSLFLVVVALGLVT